MAARLKPCWGCPLREGCDLRAEWVKRVSGLGLRSASFNCPKLGAEVRRGRRVVINQVVAKWDRGEYDLNRREVHATITGVRAGHAFSCIVDPGQITADDLVDPDLGVDRFRFRRTQPYWRIVRFLDQPDGTICELGSLMRGETCDNRDGFCGCKQPAEIFSAPAEVEEAF